MNKYIPFLFSVIALLLAPHAALAHAVVITCVPRIGSNSLKPPAQLVCQFDQPLDITKSTLTVTDAAGQRVDGSDTQYFLGDHQTLVVSLDPAKMKDGLYSVQWAVTDTLDFGATSGKVQFGVNTIVPPTATPVLPGVAMTPVPVTTGDGAGTLISRFFVGAGIVVLLAVGVLFWRMRTAQAQE